MEREHPIIVKMESQKVDGYFNHGRGYGTRILNIGIDRNGTRWQFYSEHITDHESGLTMMGQDYGFKKLGAMNS